MIKNLLNYQTEDAKLRKIETELSGSEARKKAVNAKAYIDGAVDLVNKLDAKASALMNEYNSLTASVKELETLTKEFEKAVEEVADKGEAQYIQKKIDDGAKKIKNLLDSLSALENQIQSVIKEYVTVKGNTKNAQAQYAQYGNEYNKLKESKKDEREALEKSLKEIEKTVDSSLMEKYLEKRKNKIFPIVFGASGDFCPACGIELPLTLKSKLKAEEIVECSCGRLLYSDKK